MCNVQIIRDLCTLDVEKDVLVLVRSKRFTALDVFATLILAIYYDGVFVYRGESFSEDVFTKAKVVYDITNGKCSNKSLLKAGTRINDIPYSFLGLLWNSLGHLLVSNSIDPDESLKYVDIELIQGIDAIENGLKFKKNHLCKLLNVVKLISFYNPSCDDVYAYAKVHNLYLRDDEKVDDSDSLSFMQMFDSSLSETIDIYSKENMSKIQANGLSAKQFIDIYNILSDQAFLKTLPIAENILNTLIGLSYAKAKNNKMVDEAIEHSKNGIMVLDEDFKWDTILLHSLNPKAKEIKFVIFPTPYHTSFRIMAVPVNLWKGIYRIKFPGSWFRKSRTDLVIATSITDILFVGKTGNVAGVLSLDGAIELAKLVLTNSFNDND